MSERKIPTNIPPLFNIQSNDDEVAEQEILEPKLEAQRVVKRLAKIIEDHQKASAGLNITIGETEILTVVAALRDHAKGGTGALLFETDDEIYRHCLTRLFEELVEEPSNILYSTPTGPSSTRYDSMNVPFWLECLDLLEKSAPTISQQ
jgi:hypothetical protein